MRKNIIYNLLFFINIFCYSLNNVSDFSSDVKSFDNRLNWKKMTLEEKIGQMIMIRVSGKFYNNPDVFADAFAKALGIDRSTKAPV